MNRPHGNGDSTPSSRGAAADLLRQWANLILALSPPVVSTMAIPQGNQFFEASQDPPIVPAAYAFSIWGLIFAWTIAYAIFQLLPGRRGDPLLRRVGWWTAAAFFTTSLWLILARERLIWMTFVDIVTIFATLLPVFLITHRTELSTVERWMVRFPFAVFTAWISVAMFANLTTALDDSGFSWARSTGWTILLLCLAAFLAILLIRVAGGSIPYAITIIWAAVAIAVDNYNGGRVAIAIAAGVFVVVVLVTASMAYPRRLAIPSRT